MVLILLFDILERLSELIEAGYLGIYGISFNELGKFCSLREYTQWILVHTVDP